MSGPPAVGLVSGLMSVKTVIPDTMPVDHIAKVHVTCI